MIIDLKKQIIDTLSKFSFPDIPNASRLIFATACQESQMGKYNHQIGIKDPYKGGIGVFQMEKFTHDDLWTTFIPVLKKLQSELKSKDITQDVARLYELPYSIVMCRIRYYRSPFPIPDNIPAMAAYWKKFYNTLKGKGTIEEFIKNYEIYKEYDHCE